MHLKPHIGLLQNGKTPLELGLISVISCNTLWVFVFADILLLEGLKRKWEGDAVTWHGDGTTRFDGRQPATGAV